MTTKNFEATLDLKVRQCLKLKKRWFRKPVYVPTSYALMQRVGGEWREVPIEYVDDVTWLPLDI